MNKSDLFLFFGFLFIIGGMFSIALYIYVDKVNDCTSDPLKFAVEKIRNNYDAEYVYGSMTFYKDMNYKTWYFGDDNELNTFNISK